MYKAGKIIRMQFAAHRFGLSGAHLLDDLTAVSLQCNGIGAAWFPKWFRWLITSLCPDHELAACIHDRRYSIGGSEQDRIMADTEFLTNIELIALNHWWLRRWIDRRIGIRMYKLLRFGGKFAWRAE